MKLNNNQKGLLAEKHFEFYAASKGIPAVPAHSAFLHYDLAARFTKKRGWEKVQVKFCGHKRASSATPSVDLRRNNEVYSSKDVDYIYCYCPESRRAWLIPMKKLRGRLEIIPSSPEFDEFKVTP